MLYHAPATERWCPQRGAHVSTWRVKLRAVQPVRCSGSGKGFGSTTQKKAKEEDPGSSGTPSSAKRIGKSKGKVQRRAGIPPSQPQQTGVLQQQGPTAFGLAEEEGSKSLVDEIEFEQRLKSLKQEAEVKKQEVKAKQGAPVGGILDTKRKDEDLYSNPPSLTQTLFGGKKEGGEDYGGASFGPGQVALAATSLALVGVFVIANANSDLSYTMTSSKAPTVQQSSRTVELSEERRLDLEGQLATFQEQLRESPDSTEALEGAAVINARLGNFREAVQQLQQLQAAKPSDSDVWRVLAECQSAMGDRTAALASYSRGWQEIVAGAGDAGLAGGALDLLQQYAAELVAGGQEKQAVDLVIEARALVSSRAAEGAAAGGLGPVEVELLLGKVYSQWRGHTGDALLTYEALAQSNPEDFRVFLAKGLLLRDQGRQADAQRAFIQARYLAPKESRVVVDSIINRQR